MRRLLRALYANPGAGTSWEHHCDDLVVKQMCVIPNETRPSCFYTPTWKLVLSVYVGDFKMNGPEKYMEVVWKPLQKHKEMEEPVPAGLYLGCKHSGSISKVDDGMV